MSRTESGDVRGVGPNSITCVVNPMLDDLVKTVRIVAEILAWILLDIIWKSRFTISATSLPFCRLSVIDDSSEELLPKEQSMTSVQHKDARNDLRLKIKLQEPLFQGCCENPFVLLASPCLRRRFPKTHRMEYSKSAGA